MQRAPPFKVSQSLQKLASFLVQNSSQDASSLVSVKKSQYVIGALEAPKKTNRSILVCPLQSFKESVLVNYWACMSMYCPPIVGSPGLNIGGLEADMGMAG